MGAHHIYHHLEASLDHPDLGTLLERFVTAVEDIADSYHRQAEYAEEGLELSRQHVAAQAQMVDTGQALEDKLIASMTPKKGARS